MSVWNEIKESIRQIIVMESRIDQLSDAVDRISERGLDHEKRLVRIETMIEMAQASAQPIAPEIGKA